MAVFGAELLVARSYIDSEGAEDKYFPPLARTPQPI